LTAADGEAYAALRREMLDDTPWSFGQSPEIDPVCDAAGFAARIANPRNAVVGVFEDAALVSVVGVAAFDRPKTRHRAGIWGVYTTPAARGKGYARAAMRAAIELARSWDGVRCIGLSVSGDAPEADGLYRSLGFEEWGREPLAMVVDGKDRVEVHLQLRL
jgi:GNAT superfamily N-acetyltransferase